jgi:predicted ester cyclase
MDQTRLIEQFMQDLHGNPGAVPPPDLDAAVAEFVRQLVLAEQVRPASHDVRVRVWERVLAGSPADTRLNIVRHSEPSTNHRQARKNDPNRRKETTMESVLRGPIVYPGRRAVPSPGRLFALAVAALGAVLFGGFLLFFVMTHLGNGPAAVYISPEKANQAVFERYIHEAWNAGNTGILNELLATDHVCYEPGKPEAVGIQPMIDLITTYRTAFPDWQFAIEDLVATEDAVWARLEGTGTQSGPFTWTERVTVAPTDSAVTVEVVIMARFADGKITEQSFQYDALGLLRQLEGVQALDTYLTEQRNMAIMRRMIDDTNRHDVDAMRAYYGAAMHWHPGSRGHYWRDLATQLTFYPALFGSFPDLQGHIEHLAAAGDLVYLHITFTGTFERSYFSPVIGDVTTPTHQEETWSWFVILRFDQDDKIVEGWLYEDLPFAYGSGVP